MIESPPRTSNAAGSSLHPEVTLGVVLSPEDFAQECRQTRQKPAFYTWAVGMELPDAVVRVFESQFVPVSTELAVFSSPSGINYPVVALQAGALQVRVLLSLADTRTQRWFKEALTTGRFHLAIGVTETSQLVVIQGRCHPQSHFETEAAIQRSCIVELEQAGAQGFVDRLRLGLYLLKPDAVRSGIPELQVETVRLVIVADDDELSQSLQPTAGAAIRH